MARESSVNVVRDELSQSTEKLSRMLQMETTVLMINPTCSPG